MPLPNEHPSNPVSKWFKRAWSWLRSGQIKSYHQELFQWHCDTFFPFDQHLSEAEMRYLHTCFRLPSGYLEIPESGYDGYSYYTYSHRIVGDKVNSSRFAYGSVLKSNKALKAALPIFKEKGISIDPYFLEDENSKFYGLGWDILEGHLKVYFRIPELSLMHNSSLLSLLEEDLPRYRPEGLISFTYIEGQLHEEKVYVYPYDRDPSRKTDTNPGTQKLPHQKRTSQVSLFPGAKGRALMATSKRGIITQYDVDKVKYWRNKLSDVGLELIKKYDDEMGETLDTIAMVDRDNYTLYFP